MLSKTFKIRVITNARQNQIMDLGADNLKVKLTARPVDGQANKALINLLADHFQVKKSNVIIARGQRSKNKLVSIIFP